MKKAWYFYVLDNSNEKEENTKESDKIIKERAKKAMEKSKVIEKEMNNKRMNREKTHEEICKIEISNVTVNNAIKEEEKQMNPLTKKEKKIISDFNASLSDNEYQLKCQWAIQTLESKLSMIDAELRDKKNRVVVSQVTHRIKSAESIYRKMQRKEYKISLNEAKKKLDDIIGVRVTCLFQDDVYEIVNCLSLHGDIHILKIKDYIKEPKETGYQSLHMIVEVPIYLKKKAQWVKVEMQLRTVAMDFWSVLDYQLLYKKEVRQADEISEELKHYAEVIADVDMNMMKLRDRISAIE